MKNNAIHSGRQEPVYDIHRPAFAGSQSRLCQASVNPGVKPKNKASQTWSSLVKPKTFSEKQPRRNILFKPAVLPTLDFGLWTLDPLFCTISAPLLALFLEPP